MEPDLFIECVKVDGAALLAAGRGDPTAPVPSCPGWDMSDLVGHIGSAHRWVGDMVRTRATEMGAFPDRPEDWDVLCAWYEEGMSMLVTVLEDVGADEPVWNWIVMGPGPARFWHRRVAQETAVHRWDAEHAGGVAHPLDTALAADGIDEYLHIVSFWLALTPRPELSGSLALSATDAPVEFTLALAPDHIDFHPGLDETDAVVRASTSDLLLWLLGRRGSADEAVSVEGDQSVARAWTTVKFG